MKEIDYFFFNVTVEEYRLALRASTHSMSQGPGLEKKAKVTAHMPWLRYKPSSPPCLQEC